MSDIKFIGKLRSLGKGTRGVTIPKEYLDFYDLEEGQVFEVVINVLCGILTLNLWRLRDE